ncbi:hypothetical protein FHG87_009192 [Trinorchestia longiramus]|nr:hypothetical protein FHG87_009192 [Trinorchestia longiramus]
MKRKDGGKDIAYATQSLTFEQLQPRGEGGRAVALLPHELTNRVQHNSRHRAEVAVSDEADLPITADRLAKQSSAGSGVIATTAEYRRRMGEHRTRQQEEDELLAGELLLQVRPRNATAAAAHGAGAAKKKGLQQQGGKGAKTKQEGLSGQTVGGSNKAARLSDLTKEMKGRRASKKLSSAKKRTWKKASHKEKSLRNRQAKKELKDKLTKKEKIMTKEMQKAKALLKKEKAQKKKERRERRAKYLGYSRKRD